MKNLLYVCILLMPFILFSQNDGYVQFETIQLTVRPGHGADLSTNMRAHNQKYHSEAPYTAAVFGISTGPNAGKLVWAMGPCTFSDLDNRPSAGGHDEDWATTVVPHLREMSHVEYWRLDPNTFLNRQSPGDTPYPIYRIRYFTVEKDQGYRVDGHFAKVKAALEELGIQTEWGIWDNQFRQGQNNGRHVAAISGMNGWSELDQENKFVAAFEKVHGTGSMTGFGRETDEIFANYWDEYWTYDKNMSGADE